jgi:hypothetical protein
MLGTVWAFLKDPGNQPVLSWIGGGVVVASGGIWAVVKFFAKERTAEARNQASTPKAEASQLGGKTKTAQSTSAQKLGTNARALDARLASQMVAGHRERGGTERRHYWR